MWRVPNSYYRTRWVNGLGMFMMVLFALSLVQANPEASVLAQGVATSTATKTATRTPLPTNTPTSNWTPTPLPVATYKTQRVWSHFSTYNYGMYGLRAQMHVGSPLLRWPDFSYSNIWITGLQSVDDPPPSPGTPSATPTSAWWFINSPTPSSTPTGIPTASSPANHVWIEAGFDRAAPNDYGGVSCEMTGIWAVSPGVPQWAFHAFGGAQYDVELLRTDMAPSPWQRPPNPNPSTPLWTVRFWLANPSGRVLVYSKADIQPHMMDAFYVQWGGELLNKWPEPTPWPLNRLNDMGRTTFTMVEKLLLSGPGGAPQWSRISSAGPMVEFDPKLSIPIPRPKYRAYRANNLRDANNERAYLVDGYNEVSMANTWAPCDCDTRGGLVPCNSP